MKFFGHPIHPMLVHFPIACWTLAVLTDAGLLITGDPFWARAAIWLLGAGLAFGGLAAVAGLMELGQLRQKPEAENTVSLHVTLMLAAFAAAGASFFGRLKGLDSGFSWPQIAGVICVLLLLSGAFFGANLVYKFGFGRHEQD